MVNRHVIYSIVTIIFTVGVIVFFSRSILFSGSSAYVDDSNWNQIGTLVYNSPGMKQDVWFIVYEEPGKPALFKELRFDSASACAVNAPAAPCNPSTLEAGVKVRVEGRVEGGAVLVRTIQLPEVILADVPTSPAVQPKTGSGNPATGGTTSTSTKPVPSPGTPTSTPTSTSTSTPKPGAVNGLTVKLYYYNPKLDNAQCSREGLVPVERVIPRTNTPLQDTIKLLMRGELSDKEKDAGLITEFPLSQVTLLSASSDNGTLTLTFRDPKNRTSGGSCRVSIMWSEIEATAKQFPGVSAVRFAPSTLFQP